MGTAIVKPKPKEMSKAHEKYPDIMPGGIAEYPFSNSRIGPIAFEIADGAKVLDVGCNSGEFMKMIKDGRGCDVYGIDISKNVVDIAKKKGLKVKHCDAEKLPYPDNTFDVVTLMEVLEHLDDPIAYLKEIKRVMKEDGVILGSCPHRNLEHHMWDDERLHRQYYTEQTLKEDLSKVFNKSYIRVLNGAQFEVAFANSYLGLEPCQLLFKAGGDKTEQWEEQMRKVKKLRTWFGFTALAGTVYYRMRGYAEKLENNKKLGIEPAYERFDYDGTDSQQQWQSRIVSFSPEGEIRWNSIILNQLDSLMKVADLSVWQLVQNRYALSLLKTICYGLKKPIVTETDDWLFDLPGYNIASNPYKPNSEFEWVAMEQLKLSSALICSTKYLMDHLKEFFPEKPMYLIPNSIDFKIWNHLKVKNVPEVCKKDKKMIRIGYTGCGNHIGDLELLRNVVLKILEDYENVEFIMYDRMQVGNTVLWKGIDHPRIKFVKRWVTIDQYPQEAKNWQMDIGIAPLRDNNFNRSKSNLRWLEYSALKIPTVASNVEPFKRSIQKGKTGYLCNSEVEWYEALKSLIEGDRNKMGEEAYKVVKKHHNMDVIAKEYARVLKEIKLWIDQNLKRKVGDS